MFLVKDDASITRDQQDVIFYGSVEERRRQQKETKRRRWRHHHDNINAAKSYPLADDLQPLMDCHDLFLLDKLPNGSGHSSQSAVDRHADDIADDIAAAAAAAGAGEPANVEEDDDVPRIELDLV